MRVMLVAYSQIMAALPTSRVECSSTPVKRQLQPKTKYLSFDFYSITSPVSSDCSSADGSDVPPWTDDLLYSESQRDVKGDGARTGAIAFTVAPSRHAGAAVILARWHPAHSRELGSICRSAAHASRGNIASSAPGNDRAGDCDFSEILCWFGGWELQSDSG